MLFVDCIGFVCDVFEEGIDFFLGYEFLVIYMCFFCGCVIG